MEETNARLIRDIDTYLDFVIPSKDSLQLSGVFKDIFELLHFLTIQRPEIAPIVVLHNPERIGTATNILLASLRTMQQRESLVTVILETSRYTELLSLIVDHSDPHCFMPLKVLHQL